MSQYVLVRILLTFALALCAVGCVSENVPYFIYCAPGDVPHLRGSYYSTHVMVEGYVWEEEDYLVWVDAHQRTHLIYGQCRHTPHPKSTSCLWLSESPDIA